ncbi:hypothetical protein [Mycolicibacterium austroafricanum]|uniref:hypothetical protein n=1 Tax=Mycolicibacterium austroafricanum TaxID=39687 RepID=UPI001F289563|nr:hypothetical protein [Mycolicibacterium austroafricanum]
MLPILHDYGVRTRPNRTGQMHWCRWASIRRREDGVHQGVLGGEPPESTQRAHVDAAPRQVEVVADMDASDFTPDHMIIQWHVDDAFDNAFEGDRGACDAWHRDEL